MPTMLNWIFRNLRTFSLAFALALTVWIMAVIADDPDETRVYPRTLALEVVGQDPRLILTDTLPKQVSLTLRAPQSVWTQLTTSDSQVRALLDLAGLAAGQHEIPVQLQIKLSPVRVISLTPQTITVNLEALETKTLPIELITKGQPAIGYRTGSAELTQSQVVLSGPQSLVEQAAKAQIEIKIEGARTSIGAETSIRILNAEGKIISGITLNPEKVSAQIPITQQGGYRDIAVKIVVRGQVASGYRLTNISVFPPALTVFSGDTELVNDLPGYVETEPLNLNGASQNIELSLGLILPTGVSVVGEQTVMVQVGIDAIEGSLSLNNMAVEVLGLENGLSAVAAPTTVDIILTGPLPLLEKLTANDIRVTVDATGLNLGAHQIAPIIEILIADIEVQSIIPGTVEIVISNTTTGTP